MHKLAQPVKLWYSGPFFRHERPQAGRYRQFHQIGAEAIGTDSPLADAEVIMLLDDLLAELGVPGVELRLGQPRLAQTCAAAYLEELKAYLREHEGELSDDVRARIDANPLRAFDAKDEGTQAVMAGAPKLLDRLDGEDAEHFGEVRRPARPAPASSTSIDPALVRGLDYYTRTVFAFTARGSAPSPRSAAAAATTAWSSSSAARGTRRSAGRRASSGSCSRSASGERRRRATSSSPSPSPEQARAGAGAGERAAPRRPRRRARPRRPQPQGPAQAGRPRRRPADADPRGGRLGAAPRHGVGRAAAARPGASRRRADATSRRRIGSVI